MENKHVERDLESRSPWSLHGDKGKVSLQSPEGKVEAVLTVSGSKSLTNRALIIAALAEGTSVIEGILRSDDSFWCIDALTRLGIKLEVDGNKVTVEGGGGLFPLVGGELYVGAAGTVARFLPGALAVQPAGAWKITGSAALARRPLSPLLDALSDRGAEIQMEKEGSSLPYLLKARGLQGGNVILPGDTSSQFISGLAIAAPYAREPLTIAIKDEVVQQQYVEMTLDMMAAFGVVPHVTNGGQAIVIPNGAYRGRSIVLEPDISACCYFWALAALTGGTVKIEGIHAASTRQPDIELLGYLELMGCMVTRGEDFVEVQGPEVLRGGFTANMKSCSDQTLTLAVLAIFADAPVSLTGAAHIRKHECDRISAICEELGKLSITVDEKPDGLTVYPETPVPATLDPHDDHRMAMALSLISSRIDGISIANPGCVSKTLPDYYERLQQLGFGITFETWGGC
ncbi:3-phosphoshikimate 1-carboxyvinyltransferase [Paenibacillus oryzae]|uniref:3-phosphoshikimate 1-carboxyvinyltransferase n=1 Tax=Paenibacillus oryzae TaxID=1844972 RepID=A0A1A5YPP6_9BACL|nr:3-phosphoshikimate 1-carboxyvinyltransferase [Paenibacillus oryzae]OBR67574.1 3-phosphoshikimate 1-carboxyvinyltransferase [Paenibacillus oryzae]